MKKNNYYVPESIKLIDGDFWYGHTVTLLVDGKEMKRKVNYHSLEGNYVVINGAKYGKCHLAK